MIHYCNKKKIQFLSTAFDIKSVDLLVKYNVPFLKIPSGEITNFPYLKHIGSKNKPIVMSTGMSTMSEVAAALDVLIGAGSKKKKILQSYIVTQSTLLHTKM